MNGERACDDVQALVADMDEAAIERILLLAAGLEMDIVHPPRAGLVMMSRTDSFGCDFHLGEVLVTEAELGCRGRRGYGMVIGDRPRWALASAAAELIMKGDDPELSRALCRIGETEEQRIGAVRRQERELTARTRVSFDLMPGK